jgi:predicted protein tyrosine phosphatase
MTIIEDSAAPIHVCSLAALDEVVHATRASHVLTVINPWSIPETPAGIRDENHLKIAINDIEETQPGLVAPEHGHIEQIVSFSARWNRERPLVIHCLAGISRSTAAAFITMCAMNEAADEHVIAGVLRAASRSASPNRLMVRLADDYLGRNGRMVAAIDTIGHGESLLSSKPFSLPSSIA